MSKLLLFIITYTVDLRVLERNKKRRIHVILLSCSTLVITTFIYGHIMHNVLSFHMCYYSISQNSQFLCNHQARNVHMACIWFFCVIIFLPLMSALSYPGVCISHVARIEKSSIVVGRARFFFFHLCTRAVSPSSCAVPRTVSFCGIVSAPS